MQSRSQVAERFFEAPDSLRSFFEGISSRTVREWVRRRRARAS